MMNYKNPTYQKYVYIFGLVDKLVFAELNGLSHDDSLVNSNPWTLGPYKLNDGRNHQRDQNPPHFCLYKINLSAEISCGTMKVRSTARSDEIP